MAKEGNKYKVIRFGQQGASGSPKKRANQLPIGLDGKRSKQGTLRILPGVSCRLHTGQITTKW